jgi:hypothetical protein
MTDILNAKIGKNDDGIRELKVVDVSVGSVTFEDGRTTEKLFITCETPDGERQFKISEAWNSTKKGKKVQGLWVQLDTNNNIIANSSLGKLLSYLKAESPNDLLGMKLTGYPDSKGYLVLTTYDIKDESIL